MYQIRKSKERGYADHGWLKSYHTFSFANYHDPQFMGFGPLRVINEDFIDGGEGFPTHGHRDMEIITYLVKGALEHKDSTGSSGVINPYEVQKMSAGKGIRHSEFNHLKTSPTHLLQIWIEPNVTGIEPYYQQIDFKEQILTHAPVLLASSEDKPNTLKIHQDASLWVKLSKPNEVWEKPLNPNRKYWLQVVKGEININISELNKNPLKLDPGDAIALTENNMLQISSVGQSEILFFDLA